MSDYFRHVRKEIAAVLPRHLGRTLEVGCGAGETLRWLKTVDPAIETTGVEYNAELGAALASNADHALIGSVTDLWSELGTYDTILCLDVLEHLPDSEAVLANLVARLAPGGAFVVSLPNIAHLSVSLPLVVRRRFRYADAGILDRTHVRFFVEESIIAFMNKAGLHVEAGRLSGLQGGRARLVDRLTLGLIRHHLTKQYIFRAVPGTGPQPPIAWSPL